MGIFRKSYWGDTKKVESQHLDYILAAAIDALPDNAHREKEYLSVFLAWELVEFFMGRDWCGKLATTVRHIDTSRGLIAEQLRFNGVTDKDSHFRWLTQLILLAECFYNLQSIPGIGHRIQVLQNDDLEAGLGEMRCVSLLAFPEYKLRFVVPPTNAPIGTCYEAEFTSPASRNICCEIKTKRADTPLTEQTIHYTLEHARKQMRKGSPGIVIMQAAESWRNDPKMESLAEAAARRIFRQSQRLVAFVLSSDEWIVTPERRYFVQGSSRMFNFKSPLLGDDIYEVLMRPIRVMDTPLWVNLQRYVVDYLARTDSSPQKAT